MFKMVPNLSKYEVVEKLNKGWSGDDKYILKNPSGEKYLLRLSPMTRFEQRKGQYDLLKRLNPLDIPLPKVIDFGQLDDTQCYLLLTYLEGEEASDFVQSLSPDEQYDEGIKLGQVLSKIHQADTGPVTTPWIDIFKRKITRKIERIEKENIDLPLKEKIIAYALAHMDLVSHHPSRIIHGDFHINNMIVHEEKIYVVDLDRIELADAHDDFKPFAFNVWVSPYFQTGIIDGYFMNEIPDNFFEILKLYAVDSLLAMIPWAITFGEAEVKNAYRLTNDVLKWYNNLELTIPTWYKKP